MTTLVLALAGALSLAACAEEAEETTDETAADTTAVEPAGITLDDIAGTWNMRSVPVSGEDTAATEYQLVANSAGITMYLPDRDPLVATVTVSGDSIMTEAGPFESVRRDGVMVTTRAVLRLEGDQLVGTTMATYDTPEADVLELSTTGTRAP